MNPENLKSIAGILVIFLGLPLAILLGRDVLSRLRLKRPLFWVALPFLLGFGILMPLCIDHWTPGRVILMASMELAVACSLLGLLGYNWAFRGLSLLIFLAYAAYCVYEFGFSSEQFSFTGRRSEASPRNALLGLVIIGVPCLWYALKGRLSGDDSFELTPEEAAAAAERLRHPEWAFYERHLQRPAPEALRQLYADEALLTADEQLNIKTPAGKTVSVRNFNPLNEDSLFHMADELGFDIVPFAIDDCGDPFFLRPGANEPDTVYIAYHEQPGKTTVVADSMADMLALLRSEQVNSGKVP